MILMKIWILKVFLLMICIFISNFPNVFIFLIILKNLLKKTINLIQTTFHTDFDKIYQIQKSKNSINLTIFEQKFKYENLEKDNILFG